MSKQEGLSKREGLSKQKGLNKKNYLQQTWTQFDWRTWKKLPNSHQQLVVRYALTYLSTNQMLIRWDMGQGKTLLAILWAECIMCQRWRHDHKTFSKCVVVAAPTLQENFRTELLAVGFDQMHIDTFYEFWSFEMAAKHRNDFVKACKNNYVVVDEVHRIRTEIVLYKDQQASKGANALAILMGTQGAQATLALTGTVYVNAPSDVLNLCHLMSRTIPAVGDTNRDAPPLDVQAKIFQGRVSESSRNIESGPTFEEVQVLIEMNPEFYKAYLKVENDKREELKRLNELDLHGTSAFFSGLRQAANKINSVLSQKRQFVMEIVLAAKREKKRVVITSAFLNRGLQLLAQSFPMRGIRFVQLDGQMEQKDRQNSINLFNDMSAPVDAIIVSGAGTTGTNLKASSIQINFESHWNEATRQQANFRSVRLDSFAKHIVIYNLMMLKPGKEFWNVVQELQQLLATKPDTPGLPTKILPIPNLEMLDASMGMSNTKEQQNFPTDSGGESIDLHLFRLQLKKSAELFPLRSAMQKWSIEAMFGNQISQFQALPTKVNDQGFPMGAVARTTNVTEVIKKKTVTKTKRRRKQKNDEYMTPRSPSSSSSSSSSSESDRDD